MRALIALTCLTVFALVGCDSSGPERVPQNVFVKAESVTFVEITTGPSGRNAAVFDYVGSVPATCYEFSGYSGTGDEQRQVVAITARATAESCEGGQSPLRIERLSLSAFSGAPGTYTYAFDRLEAVPIEVRVTFP